MGDSLSVQMFARWPKLMMLPFDKDHVVLQWADNVAWLIRQMKGRCQAAVHLLDVFSGQMPENGGNVQPNECHSNGIPCPVEDECHVNKTNNEVQSKANFTVQHHWKSGQESYQYECWEKEIT